MNADAAVQIGRNALFAGLPDSELVELAALTTPWAAEPGWTLFHQGEPGEDLLFVSSGRLEARLTHPSGTTRALGTAGPGEIVGELSLLAGGRRMASVRALEPSAGLALSREAFDLLRLQLRPAARAVAQRIGTVALARLGQRYRQLADEHRPPDPDSHVDHPAAPLGRSARVELYRESVSNGYLAETLFFRRFDHEDIQALRSGLRVLSAPRGASIPTTDALWIVLRGAAQTLIGTGSLRRRVRLAGPGRAVGHLCVLESDAVPVTPEVVLRERAVLLEVPRDRARALLDGDQAHARQFAGAFHEDVARALIAAEEPLAPLVHRAPTPSAPPR